MGRKLFMKPSLIFSQCNLALNPKSDTLTQVYSLEKLSTFECYDIKNKAVVIIFIFFLRLRLLDFNAKEINYKERITYHWETLIWFTFLNISDSAMIKNKKNVVL